MTITRRDLFRAAAAVGIASAVGATPPLAASSGALTLADLLRAEAMLSTQSVPPFCGGNYVMFLHPRAYEEVALGSLTAGATYRVRETAWSLMRHERRREEMGKRCHVTAAEVFERVSEGDVAAVPLPRDVSVVRSFDA